MSAVDRVRALAEAWHRAEDDGSDSVLVFVGDADALISAHDAHRTRAEAAEAELARLLAVEAAAGAHVTGLAALVDAEAAHAGPQPTPAGRHGAMAAVLIRRRGVVGTVAALAWAVGE